MIHTGLKTIEKRRKEENGYRAMEALIASDRRALHIATFEQSTNQKLEQRNKKERLEYLRRENQKALLSRREQLADLYNSEMQGWENEILSRVETLEDRKARIMERAYALRDAREESRKKFVDESLERQWRDACDDARLLDSKALTKHMSNERLRQIQEKIQRKQQLTLVEEKEYEEWQKQLDIMYQKDLEKRNKQKKADEATAEGLRHQMSDNRRMKDEYFDRMHQEAEEEIAEIRRAIADEEEIQRRRREEAFQRGREVLEFNKEYKYQRAEESKVEKEHDAILLDFALRKEREQLDAEEAKRQAGKQAAIQFKKYLEELMIREKEDTAFIDEVRRKEEEKVWKARDDALKARDDARAYLLKLVDEGRKQQIQARKEQLVREREEGKVFASKFLDDAREGVEKERADVRRRHEVAKDNNMKLLDQVAMRRHKEELEKQEQYLADKKMRYMERQLQQKLTIQGGTVNTFYPLKQSQWYS